MYGFSRFVMFLGMGITIVPFVTDVTQFAFLHGLGVPPNQACSIAGFVLIVGGFVARKLSAPSSSGLV